MNFSIFLDIKILFLTLRIIFTSSATEGIKEVEDFREIIKSMGKDIYDELGITRIE